MQFPAPIQGSLHGFARSHHLPDSRHKWFAQKHYDKCWELDAINPNDLRGRLANAILDHIDQEAWSDAVEVEKVDVESMREFATSWTSILKQASK